MQDESKTPIEGPDNRGPFKTRAPVGAFGHEVTAANGDLIAQMSHLPSCDLESDELDVIK